MRTAISQAPDTMTAESSFCPAGPNAIQEEVCRQSPEQGRIPAVQTNAWHSGSGSGMPPVPLSPIAPLMIVERRVEREKALPGSANFRRAEAATVVIAAAGVVRRTRPLPPPPKMNGG